MPYIGIDQLSLYLEVFSFKLRAAWSDRLDNYISGAQKYNNPNLHVFPMYFNIIISYYQIISRQQDLQEKKKLDVLGHRHLELRKYI